MLVRTLHPAPSETYRSMKTVATMLNLMIWKGTVLIVRLTAPSAHHTMGSLKVGTGRHVLNAEDAVILGLYAAGVITGGIHGGICLGGNAIVEIFVSGRTAANAIAEDKK